jgi:hypothetical protein
MAAKITTLIDKQDTNEIVRDKIAVILATEIANQKSLALQAGKTDPNDFYFDTYIERSRPWQILSDECGAESGEMKHGLVNVVFDSDSFDNMGSANIKFQRAKGVFFIDCYAHINKSNNLAGDEATSKESDRIARFVRNILMFGDYMYLDLRGVVTRRYIQKREKLQPDIRQEASENVIVTRVILGVDYEEYTEQAIPEDLENVFGECELSDTGQVLFDVDYDYTT